MNSPTFTAPNPPAPTQHDAQRRTENQFQRTAPLPAVQPAADECLFDLLIRQFQAACTGDTF